MEQEHGASSGSWHDVGSAADFADQDVSGVLAAGTPVAVFRLGEELYALHDECTHGAARLSEGLVIDDCVECPLHQGQFDLRTGAPRCPPVDQPVRIYPVRVQAERVYVLIPVDHFGPCAVLPKEKT